MLILVTGVPGAGKTLYALGLAEEYRAKGREVYHNGIEGLTLPWHLMPEDQPWSAVPDGAVVFLDEAQRTWRVRPQGARVPADVAALETHRHRGIDLILTTQSPGLIDSNVRKLVGRHFHLTRKHGRERVGVYRWEQCESAPERVTNQRQALKEMWTFPPERFTWYQSAVVHTHAKQFPWKLVAMLGGGLAVVVGLLWFAIWQLGADARKQNASPVPLEAAAGAPKMVGGGVNPWDSEARLQRLGGVIESAPYFDVLFQKPQSAPKVAGCAEHVITPGAWRCECYTGQGTVVPMDLQMCRDILRRGSFDVTKPEVEPNAEVIARLNAASAAALAAGGGGGSVAPSAVASRATGTASEN